MSRHAFKKTFFVAVPAVVLGADAALPVVECPFDGLVDSVEFIPTTGGITGANTNTRKQELLNKGQAGAGTAQVALLQYNSGVSATAFDKKTITRTATAADYTVAEGDVLAWVSTHVGTGIADPGGLLKVVISRDVSEA